MAARLVSEDRAERVEGKSALDLRPRGSFRGPDAKETVSVRTYDHRMMQAERPAPAPASAASARPTPPKGASWRAWKKEVGDHLGKDPSRVTKADVESYLAARGGA